MGMLSLLRQRKTTGPVAATSIYDTIGGHEAIEVVVEDFYNRVLADHRLSGCASQGVKSGRVARDQGAKSGLIAEHIQRVLQIVRVRADDLYLPAIGGMSERQRPRV